MFKKAFLPDKGIIKTLNRDYPAYPVQLEEAFNLFTFSSSAAHQQMTELIHWPQFLEDMTPLQDGKERTLNTQDQVLLHHNNMEHDIYHRKSRDRRFNLCREEDKLLRGDIVLLDNHR